MSGTHPMTQPDELLPCPFCGGSADVYEHTGRIMSGHYTARGECDSCEEVKGALGYGITKDEAYTNAAKLWNTRTPDLSRILKLAALSGKLIPEMKKRLNCLPTVVLSPFGKQFVAAYGQLTDEDHQLLEAVLKE